MTWRSVSLVTLRVLVVLAATGAAWALIAVASAGARADRSVLDPEAARLAAAIHERDSLTQRVAELEARPRTPAPVANRSARLPPTTMRRWVEPTSTAGRFELRVCAAIVEVEESAQNVPGLVLARDVCGAVDSVAGAGIPATVLDSLMNDELFRCWLDAAPLSGAPACLRLLTADLMAADGRRVEAWWAP